jgi:predicted metal-dependent peptidase
MTLTNNNLPHPTDKLNDALFKFMRLSPFYSTLALLVKVEFSNNPQIITAATNGNRILLNGNFFDTLNLLEQVGLILHETMHLAFLHHFRCGTRDLKLWNVACDYAINLKIKEMRIPLIKGALVNNAFMNMTEEEIYEIVKNTPKEYANYVPDILNDSTSHEDNERKRTILSTKIFQAANTSREIGTLPGDVSLFIDSILKPKEDWRSVLSEYLTALQKGDYDWTYPSRRSASHGIILPGIRVNRVLDHIAIVLDTSSSVTNQELTTFVSEIIGIVNQCRPHFLTVIPCDTVAYKPITFDHIPEPQTVMQVFNKTEDIKGGGGTDLIMGLESIDESRKKEYYPPTIAIVMTDGETEFKEKLDFPVIWCITNPDIKAPWGRTIHLNIEKYT